MVIWRVQEALWSKLPCPFIVSQCSNSIPFPMVQGWGKDGDSFRGDLWGKFSLILRDTPRGCEQEAGCPDAAVSHPMAMGHLLLDEAPPVREKEPGSPGTLLNHQINTLRACSPPPLHPRPGAPVLQEGTFPSFQSHFALVLFLASSKRKQGGCNDLPGFLLAPGVRPLLKEM